MSTKCSVVYNGKGEDQFHFYTDCFDHKGVFLELMDAEFQAYPGIVTVRIPWSVWEAIKKTDVAAPPLDEYVPQ